MDISISVNEVAKQLSKLNPGKAPGPDNLPPRVLKELLNEIVPFLADIVNTPLAEGVVPDDSKNASLTPVYKKVPKPRQKITDPSLLPVSVVKSSNIMTYLDKNQLLYQNQHGFRSKLSCETQLIQFTQDLSDSLNEGWHTDVIVMDFSKASDKVGHQRLLFKLHRLGIN